MSFRHKANVLFSELAPQGRRILTILPPLMVVVRPKQNANHTRFFPSQRPGDVGVDLLLPGEGSPRVEEAAVILSLERDQLKPFSPIPCPPNSAEKRVGCISRVCSCHRSSLSLQPLNSSRRRCM